MRYPSPGPLARATLSRWERDLPECFFHFAGGVAHSDGIKENHFDLTTTPAFGHASFSRRGVASPSHPIHSHLHKPPL
jgi:hypothetical protein